MVGSAQKKRKQETPMKGGRGGLTTIKEEGTPVSQVSPALSKPNISTKNLHS